MDKEKIRELFDVWTRKLRILPGWDVRLQFVENPGWRKSGDIKIDCDDKKAVVLLNAANPRQENTEEVLVHELLHLKIYPLDQTTETLIDSIFPEEGPARNFAMTQFFTTLEQTVEELAKCFLLEFGENRELSFGRCMSGKSFNDLFDGLKNLE